MAEEMCKSCVDCGVINCSKMNKYYPDFCLTTALSDEEIAEAKALYMENEDLGKAARCAAEVEMENYCKMTRVEETIEYAKKMGFTRIGIATCVGLIRESRMLAKILRSHGLQVFGVACKAGAQKKVSIGIDPKCEAVGENMCNPILQAKLLNKAKTELNIVVGLCVGHDSLFYKHAEALTTTLIAKDRVTGHNPVAALYCSESYYHKKLYGNSEELLQKPDNE